MRRGLSMRRSAGSWLVFLALAASAVVVACEGDDPAPLDPDDQGPAGQAGSPPQGCTPVECLSACQIGGATVARGALDPANSCAQCDPTVARNAWSPLADGQACGAGRVCEGGACAA
ncbi:MAG TPA: hypothetical protein VFS00_02340, partial [Polyangiaceae bacterium]|nr:hypothetical protein [Polyangiaceae bacterium]